MAQTACAAHGQCRVVPVDVIEFEMDHFTGTQSQPCQELHNGIVATPHGRALIDAGQQLTDVISRNRTWDRGHGPVGHHRNGCCQIQLHFAAILGILQERAQRTGHELGALLVQTRRLALDKSHDIAGAQACEGDRSVCEPICQKTVDERPVVKDGRFGQATYLAQILLVLLRTTLCRRALTYRSRFSGNDAFAVEKVHDMLKCSGIAWMGFELSSAIT
jgi:hypothetical protein